jgi:adenosylcobinamide-GDP ribazoletransferase
VRALFAAIGFLTRLPVPRGKGDFAAAVRLYPAAGLAVGAVVAGAGWAGAALDPWLGALAAMVGWTWVTGALHLDGLADLADGLGAAHGDRARLLAVMAEPQVGSFGVVAIVVQLAAKLVLLHLLLPAAWLAVLLVPAAARIGPLGWARYLAPLRPGGLGAAIAGAVRNRDLLGWVALLAAMAVFVPVLALTPLLVLLVGWWFRRRAGGVTGDLHGAGIELVETGLLLALAVQAAA